ncbi:MAG: N-acetylmuramoyl-L-alanine amidase [Prevotella sp.]|nr:N-acetylmuramoyl-L-alanine amidase [Prevotella sp.]
MRKIERIFVHCTASNQSWGVRELLAEFRHKGWKNPGYHYVITANGGIHQMLAIEEVSNGVQGYNATAINIAYVGGISKVNGKTVTTDNRTPEQKASLRKLLVLLRHKFPDAKIMGHRSIWGEDTPSKWHKRCPCFNAMAEYADI